LVLLLGCATSGQRDKAPRAAADPAAATPPLGTAPSLRETGRIAAMNVSNTGVQIDAPPADRTAAREQRVDARDDESDPVTRPIQRSAGIVDAAILKREIRSRFAELNDCPREVARHTRAASLSRARRLTLRWTILPTGQVANTAVVATSPVNVQVMDCVKRQMSLWSFAPPRGGAYSVERSFAFGR
jgi:hypothetical protein